MSQNYIEYLFIKHSKILNNKFYLKFFFKIENQAINK